MTATLAPTSAFAAGVDGFRAGTSALPAPLRPQAALGVLDATEWFGETSGGIRTYLLEKARYVAARPHLRHTVVVPGAADSLADHDGVRFVRLRGPAIPRHRPYRFMLATRSVSRLVEHERPDIIEVGSPFVVPWILQYAVRASRTPLVYYHHTDVARVVSHGFPGGAWTRRRVIDGTWRYLRALERRCAMTIVATEGGRRELLEHGFSRVTRIPLGVDLDTFHPVRRAHRDDTRARFALPPGPLALFAGRFAREKELDVVLEAWERVEARTGFRLVLVGAGPDETRLRAHRYGARVLFRPYVQERSALADLLAACDVYVAPGPAETFGLSAIEAMASGTPVLSVSRGAVAEHVVRSGAGRCYELGSAESVTDVMSAMATDDLPTLGRSARTFAAAEHDWDTVFDRLFAVYEALRPR